MEIRKPNPFREKQKEYRDVVFDNKNQVAFGVEWVIRVILIYTPWWFFPGNWIKAATDRPHIFVRRILIDIYVIAKVVISWGLITHQYADNWYVTLILVWLAIETIYALLGGVFLRDVWSEPFSYQRNLTLMLINYIEICLCFAAFYTFKEHQVNNAGRSLFVINDSLISADKHLTSSQAIYFSFVTAATIGYGDISPKDESIQHIVILQIMLSLSFIVMFIANVSGKLGTGAFAAASQNASQTTPTEGPDG
ncbi:Ion channel [Mucilaginibacter lappiensis]|uniref:Potassium channel domain-containing protein n=1 Tax=Mucilaginibacter lappiensis TaxID=354630 RepID=A0ABR6PH65_9SPHI|nr:potassium channel family protein [Mucilaginibacter lappiensis]MBB6108360.1 hypothetical protein [Mucilaginibacter lappiensis]SIQ40835.1 Ion channel [Mucilaginibacter lappiensis]